MINGIEKAAGFLDSISNWWSGKKPEAPKAAPVQNATKPPEKKPAPSASAPPAPVKNPALKMRNQLLSEI